MQLEHANHFNKHNTSGGEITYQNPQVPITVVGKGSPTHEIPGHLPKLICTNYQSSPHLCLPEHYVGVGGRALVDIRLADHKEDVLGLPDGDSRDACGGGGWEEDEVIAWGNYLILRVG